MRDRTLSPVIGRWRFKRTHTGIKRYLVKTVKLGRENFNESRDKSKISLIKIARHPIFVPQRAAISKSREIPLVI